jgi:hypothetical protein
MRLQVSNGTYQAQSLQLMKRSKRDESLNILLGRCVDQDRVVESITPMDKTMAGGADRRHIKMLRQPTQNLVHNFV